MITQNFAALGGSIALAYAYARYAVISKFLTFLGRSALEKKLNIYVKMLGFLTYLDTMEITAFLKMLVFPTI